MLRIALAVVVALLLGGAPAWSASMQVMESLPAAHSVMDGTQTEFFVRFDGPVDHNASRFQIMRDGVVVQTLRPRLSSQPNVLYSGVRRLEPGSYVLHWNTRSMRDQEAAAGDIEFTVR